MGLVEQCEEEVGGSLLDGDASGNGGFLVGWADASLKKKKRLARSMQSKGSNVAAVPPKESVKRGVSTGHKRKEMEEERGFDEVMLDEDFSAKRMKVLISNEKVAVVGDAPPREQQ